MSARARSILVLVLVLVLGANGGCNLVLGLDAGTERGADAGGAGAGGAGDGGAAGAAGGGGQGAADGGGSVTTNGLPSGGGGAGGCPAEEIAGRGREIVANGSFETGVTSWLEGDLGALTISEGFCGCQSAVGELPTGQTELRNNSFENLASGTQVHARARLRGPDTVAAELTVYGSNNVLGMPAVFLADVDDPEGADGWRLAKGEWTIPALAFDNTYVYIALNGPPGTEVAFDCISVTVEP